MQSMHLGNAIEEASSWTHKYTKAQYYHLEKKVYWLEKQARGKNFLWQVFRHSWEGVEGPWGGWLVLDWELKRRRGLGWQCGELEFVLLIGRPGQYFQQLEHKTSLKSSDRCRVALVWERFGGGLRSSPLDSNWIDRLWGNGRSGTANLATLPQCALTWPQGSVGLHQRLPQAAVGALCLEPLLNQKLSNNMFLYSDPLCIIPLCSSLHTSPKTKWWNGTETPYRLWRNNIRYIPYNKPGKIVTWPKRHSK